jgi:hypothetical protein
MMVSPLNVLIHSCYGFSGLTACPWALTGTSSASPVLARLSLRASALPILFMVVGVSGRRGVALVCYTHLALFFPK